MSPVLFFKTANAEHNRQEFRQSRSNGRKGKRDNKGITLNRLTHRAACREVQKGEAAVSCRSSPPFRFPVQYPYSIECVSFVCHFREKKNQLKRSESCLFHCSSKFRFKVTTYPLIEAPCRLPPRRKLIEAGRTSRD